MMRWNVTKRKLAVKRTSPNSSLRWLLCFVFCALLGVSVFLVYRFHSKQLDQNNFYQNISHWIASRQSFFPKHLLTENETVKRSNKMPYKNSENEHSKDQAIHFEFYTALPNMQVGPIEKTKTVAEG